MGKRKNTKIKSIARAGDRTTSSSDYGGSGGNNNRFSAFEFTDDDFRPEFESRKTLSKYGTKSPNKKPVHNRLAVDKYAFLESFAQGTKGKQNVSRNDVSDVAVTDCGFQDITFVPDVAMSLGSSNYEQKPFSFPNCHCSECYCGAKSCAPRSRRSECYSTGNNKILYVDSDEDGLMGSRSRSSLNHAEDEGLLEEQSPEFGANNNDYEAEVAVAPHYAKYGKIYYTNCLLTFSKRCIRLKGSPLHERKRTHCLELLTSDILSIEHQPFESVKAEAVILRFKLKGTSTGETSNCNSGSDELEFVLLDDPQWSVKQEEIQSLDLQYKVAWERNTRECNIEESFENMVYPDGDPDAVFISREDIELLQPRTFINDTIIDFYMKYLLNKINPEEQHRFHFFNTFFFQKLVNVCPDSSRAWEGRDAFESLRKWTRNVNIFKADYVFIPVNFSLHWSLIIICHPGEVANLKDKEDSCKVPCILHMDSIRGSHGGFKHLIRRQLKLFIISLTLFHGSSSIPFSPTESIYRMSTLQRNL